MRIWQLQPFVRQVTIDVERANFLRTLETRTCVFFQWICLRHVECNRTAFTSTQIRVDARDAGTIQKNRSW